MYVQCRKSYKKSFYFFGPILIHCISLQASVILHCNASDNAVGRERDTVTSTTTFSRDNFSHGKSEKEKSFGQDGWDDDRHHER